MSRLLPSTLSGRLTLTLLVGLLAAQLLGAAILLRDRASALYQTSGISAAQRIASAVSALDRLDTDTRRLLLAALNTAQLHVTLHPGPMPTTDGDFRAEFLEAHLRRLLADSRPIHVALAAPAAPTAGYGAWHGPHAMRVPPFGAMAPPFIEPGAVFRVQTMLKDGTPIGFEYGLPETAFAWPARVLLTLAVLLLSAIGLTFLAVRGLTRPLAVLAVAADELGRDMRRAPLPENGPAEVRRAAAAFNRMQARLQAYVGERERMLAAVSHDLRTPITRLRLRSELIEDTVLRTKVEADLAEMESMTHAALEFLRGDASQEPVQPVDMRALLESLQADFEEAGHTVEVRGRIGAPYAGRPLALKRLFTNLLDNALKYGQSAEVRMCEEGGWLRVSVADRGPGIPASQFERVLEPFQRLDASRSQNSGGVGLGLSVARDIARKHGGDLVLRNRAAGGLEVTVTLPRAASRAEKPG